MNQQHSARRPWLLGVLLTVIALGMQHTSAEQWRRVLNELIAEGTLVATGQTKGRRYAAT